MDAWIVWGVGAARDARIANAEDLNHHLLGDLNKNETIMAHPGVRGGRGVLRDGAWVRLVRCNKLVLSAATRRDPAVLGALATAL